MPAPDDTDDSDEALMLRYAGGAAAAFDALYGRHRGGVYRYLLRHCGNGGLADELFQDVWMSVIRARETYRPVPHCLGAEAFKRAGETHVAIDRPFECTDRHGS